MNKITEHDVLEAANRSLHQQRASGRAAAAQRGTTLAELLAGVRPAETGEYPSAAQVQSWTQQPATFSDEGPPARVRRRLPDLT